MMVRWICGVSLKNRKRSKEFVVFWVGIQSVADIVRCGRIRWFGYPKRKNVDK